MKSLLLPAMLQLIGIAVIVAEIFIPSLGVLSVIALGVLSYSLFLVYSTVSITAGVILTGLDIVCIPIVVILGMKALARSPLSLKRELSSREGVVSQSEKLSAYVGMEGVCVTDLRPSGTAQIDSGRLDVVTDGEYIEAGTSIVVKAVEGNRMVVEKRID